MPMATKALSNHQLKMDLEEAAKNLPDAWEKLFKSLAFLVQSQIKKKFHSQPRQEQCDAAQQVLEYMWKDRGWVMNYQPDKDPMPYVVEVIRHSVYRYHRGTSALKNTRVQLARTSDEPLESITEKTQEELNNWESLQAIQPWLKELEPDDQMLFLARWLHEQPSKEVAQELDISEENVNTRFKRLKKRLETYLQRLGLLGIVLLVSFKLLGGFIPSLHVAGWKLSTDRNSTADRLFSERNRS